MDTASISYRVYQRSECPGDTAFICESCSCHLCPRCIEIHATDLETADHNVVSYRSKSNYIDILSKNSCLRHPTNVYVKYCKHCKLPILCHCTEHRKHRILYILQKDIEKYFPPSEVRLSFTDLFTSCHALKWKSKRVTTKTRSINQR